MRQWSWEKAEPNNPAVCFWLENAAQWSQEHSFRIHSFSSAGVTTQQPWCVSSHSQDIRVCALCSYLCFHCDGNVKTQSDCMCVHPDIFISDIFHPEVLFRTVLLSVSGPSHQVWLNSVAVQLTSKCERSTNFLHGLSDVPEVRLGNNFLAVHLRTHTRMGWKAKPMGPCLMVPAGGSTAHRWSVGWIVQPLNLCLS